MISKILLKHIKNGRVDKFYKSWIWRKVREKILTRDNNECQRCKVQGKYSKAECVHHIVHVKENPYLALNDNNLISLCNDCHNLEHPEKLSKMIKTNKKEPITPERW